MRAGRAAVFVPITDLYRAPTFGVMPWINDAYVSRWRKQPCFGRSWRLPWNDPFGFGGRCCGRVLTQVATQCLPIFVRMHPLIRRDLPRLLSRIM
jgi:hypothetical protein